MEAATMATVAIPAARNLADSLAIGLIRVSVGYVSRTSGFMAHSLALKESLMVLPLIV
jgi:hypothetical protein